MTSNQQTYEQYKLTSELNDTHSELQQYRHKYALLHSDYTQLQSASQLQQNNINQLTQQLSDLRTSNTNEQHTVQQLKHDQSLLYAKLTEYESQYNTVLQQSDGNSQLINQYQTYILKCESDLQSAAAEKQKYKLIFKDIETKLSTELQQFVSDKHAFKQQSVQYITKINENESTIRALHKQLADMQHAIEQAKYENIKLNEQHNSHEVEKVRLMQEHGTRDRDFIEMQNSVSGLKHEVHALTQSNALLRQEVESYQCQIDVANKQYSSAQQQLMYAEQQQDESQQRLAELMARLTDSASHERSAGDNERTADQLREQIIAMQHTNKTLHLDKASLMSQLELYKTKLTTFDTLRARLQEQQTMIEKLQRNSNGTSNGNRIPTGTGVMSAEATQLMYKLRAAFASTTGQKVRGMLLKLGLKESDIAEWLIEPDTLIHGLDKMFVIFKKFRAVKDNGGGDSDNNADHQLLQGKLNELSNRVQQQNDHKTKLIVRLSELLPLTCQPINNSEQRKQLEVLRLNDNGVDDYDINVALNAIGSNYTLREIDLRGNQITNIGLLALIDSVLSNCTKNRIELIDMQSNLITLDGLESLAVLISQRCKQAAQHVDSSKVHITSALLRKEQSTLMPIIEVLYSDGHVLVIDLRYNRLSQPTAGGVGSPGADAGDFNKKNIKKILIRVIKILNTCTNSASSDNLHENGTSTVG